jgi:DNA invertase Pin-like site-specific DNA recombinase
MERPALKRLLEHIRQGLIEVIVVYKVDRLTRSLADFAKMAEIFDAHQVSFVAVRKSSDDSINVSREAADLGDSVAYHDFGAIVKTWKT